MEKLLANSIQLNWLGGWVSESHYHQIIQMIFSLLGWLIKIKRCSMQNRKMDLLDLTIILKRQVSIISLFKPIVLLTEYTCPEA